MLAAAKDESVPLLAASLLSENSCPGFGGCDSELRRVIELANVLNASGLAASLYDDRIGSRDTGKERDSESGLDYFGARYYGSALGRFTSPDWSEKPQGVPYANLEDPQTLNLYTYVRNNPLAHPDPDGHCPICIEALESPIGQEATEWVSQNTSQIVAGAGAIFGAISAGLDNGGHSMTTYGIGENTGLNAGKSLASSAPTAQDGAQPSSTPSAGTTTNTNPYAGPVSGPVTVVDGKGNAIPVKTGEQIQGSKDGRYVQVKDADGKPTGVRIDGGHKPSTHDDPRAQQPHAHVPGKTNTDGTPWLPVNQ